MITININGEKYDCPSEWNEVTLRKFYNVMVLAEKKKDFKSDLDYTLDFIHYLSDIPKERLMDLKSESYVKLVNQLDWVSKEPKGQDIDIIEIDDKKFMFPKDLNNLTMGESISVELAIKDNEGNLAEAFINLLPILLRPVKEIKDLDNDDIKYEQIPLDTENIESRKELFMDKLMVTEVIKFRDFFFNGEGQSSIISEATSQVVNK